ncbi:MAG TPA: TauD/TfdA family dioxygenase [Polyangiaceae bacterium]|nr:TauD/TfdA family dioxygenase [Polyangiaceae bacterium]
MSAPEAKARPPLPGRRRGVASAPEHWVVAEGARGGAEAPFVLRPAVEGVDLVAWARGRSAQVEEWLVRWGAVLFRGFGVRGAADFDALVAALTPGALPYLERSSPRSQVAGNVYTSTDHPPEYPIFLHNEQSYNLAFPRHIFFFCERAAPRGGATPIGDTRRVYRRLDPALRERFERQGYLYVRNFGGRLGLAWQEAFQTTDRAEVERYCRANAIEWAWGPGDRLRTRQVRRAVARHPRTGEPCWCNHATFFHVTTLEPAVRDALLGQLGGDELPNNTYFGDGSPIGPEELEALRAAYLAELVRFDWREGDVLMLDNLLMAHGRDPFEGPRRVLTAMATPCRWDDV